MEFCGGNHIANTAEAEAFVLTAETAVTKGVRGITVITRGAAKKVVEEGEFVIHTCIIVYHIIYANNADNNFLNYLFHASSMNQICR